MDNSLYKIQTLQNCKHLLLGGDISLQKAKEYWEDNDVEFSELIGYCMDVAHTSDDETKTIAINVVQDELEAVEGDQDFDREWKLKEQLNG